MNLYRKIEVIISVDSLKSCDAALTNVKEINLQTENCFIYHKSNDTFKKCFNWTSRINALKDNEFNEFTLNFESDFDSKN